MNDGFVDGLGLGPRWRLRGSPAPRVSEVVASANRVLNSAFEFVGVDVQALRASDGESSEKASACTASACGAPVREPLARTPILGDWSQTRSAVIECVRCTLSEQRTQAVFGIGDERADWLFVGEGPGAEEDLRGEPFVGQAGKLLDAMLASLGIARGNRVYIANAVKCRPPNNRTPEPDEIEACFPYLQRQIELIQPRVIVALGRPAAQALLKQEVRIGAARGQVFRFGETPVVVTYHPAYLLRNPADKGKAWADLCFAKKTLESSPPKAVVAG